MISSSLSSLPPHSLQLLASLGERLRAQRLAMQWTVAQTAARLLCSPTTYRALEAGKPTVSLGLLVHALWLFGEQDSLALLCPMPEGGVKGRRVRRKQHSPAVIEDSERDF